MNKPSFSAIELSGEQARLGCAMRGTYGVIRVIL